MIRAADIIDLRGLAVDDPETKALQARLRELRQLREPFYLTGEDLDPVFRWKLRAQYGRQQALRATNPPDAYMALTRAAFEIRSADRDLEVELRVGILSVLRGVGVPVASAILALVEPANYCVIDFRAWRQAFDEDRRSFDVGHYKKYLRFVRGLATELGWLVQEVDAAIWEHDRRANG